MIQIGRQLLGILVDLVYFVGLVGLVYFVGFVGLVDLVIWLVPFVWLVYQGREKGSPCTPA